MLRVPYGAEGFPSVHRLPPDWMVFLEDFHRHWPTDAQHTYVDFILNGSRGEGTARMGNPRLMRLTDHRWRAARSVLQFEVRPALWRDLVPVAGLSAGQKNAFVTASWLNGADDLGELSDLLQPALLQPEQLVCGVEGWILGTPYRPKY